MKFTCTYFTSDRTRHEIVVSARSKDAVYPILKKQGIRPTQVVLSPGVLNRLASFGKRGYAILVLAVALAVSTSLYFSARDNGADNLEVETTDRHQIYGDASMIDAAIKTKWAVVFSDPGDSLLAMFAQPGDEPPILASTPEIESMLLGCLDKDVAPTNDDMLEYRQIKLIVRGLKKEMREYLKDGGTISMFVARLGERQRLEKAIYNRYVKELSEETDENAWVRKNAELREMGIKTIPMPLSMLDGKGGGR